MGKIYEYKSFELGFKDIDRKQGIVTGYFASFDTLDSDGDIFMQGAFTKTIKENFSRIKHLLDHDTRKAVGKLQELSEDSIGVPYASKVGSHSVGQDFMKMAESGIITEHSVGIQVPKNKTEFKDGVRYIKEVKMFEGSSLQCWGANQYTPLTGIKSMFADAEKVEQRMKALESFCRNSDATDETIELLLIEAKQLSQLLIDITAKEITLPVEKTTEPKEAVNWEKIAMAIQIL